MKNKAIGDHLSAQIRPVVLDLGLELWGLEYLSMPGTPVLRIYIDSEQGVDVEDCARVSRRLASVIEAESLLMTGYRLEVSSPGLDRPLFSLAHFLRYQGHSINLKLTRPVAGRSRMVGRFVALDNEQELVMEISGTHLNIPYELVKRANLKTDFHSAGGKK